MVAASQQLQSATDKQTMLKTERKAKTKSSGDVLILHTVQMMKRQPLFVSHKNNANFIIARVSVNTFAIVSYALPQRPPRLLLTFNVGRQMLLVFVLLLLCYYRRLLPLCDTSPHAQRRQLEVEATKELLAFMCVCACDLVSILPAEIEEVEQRKYSQKSGIKVARLTCG